MPLAQSAVIFQNNLKLSLYHKLERISTKLQAIQAPIEKSTSEKVILSRHRVLYICCRDEWNLTSKRE